MKLLTVSTAVVSISASDCLQRLVSETRDTYMYVSSGT